MPMIVSDFDSSVALGLVDDTPLDRSVISNTQVVL